MFKARYPYHTRDVSVIYQPYRVVESVSYLQVQGIKSAITSFPNETFPHHPPVPGFSPAMILLPGLHPV